MQTALRNVTIQLTRKGYGVTYSAVPNDLGAS